MCPQCAACGLVFEPEQGFFVGGIYVSYAVTTAIGLGSVLITDWLRPLSLAGQLALAVPLMLIVPVLFFHHSRSIWLALNCVVSGVGGRVVRSR